MKKIDNGAVVLVDRHTAVRLQAPQALKQAAWWVHVGANITWIRKFETANPVIAALEAKQQDGYF